MIVEPKDGEIQVQKEVRGSVVIGRQRIPTLKRTLCSYGTIEIEAGTNGECGGDTGHGSRTVIRLKNLGSFDISAEGGKGWVNIVLGGDSELNEIQTALSFISNAIRKLQVEAALRGIFEIHLKGYTLDADDRKKIEHTASKSKMDPAHFEKWLLSDIARSWRFLAIGGAHLLIESYDDAFTIF